MKQAKPALPYLLDLLTFFVIPVFTIFLASYDSLINSNLSVVANYLGKQNAFTLWGILIILCFYAYFHRIASRYGLNSPALRRLVLVSCLLLIFGITTPYLPDQFPLKAKLHVAFSFLASVCLLLCLYLQTLLLSRQKPGFFRPHFRFLNLLTVVCAALLLLIGIVSSLVEIVFTLSTAFYLRALSLTSPDLSSPYGGHPAEP